MSSWAGSRKTGRGDCPLRQPVQPGTHFNVAGLLLEIIGDDMKEENQDQTNESFSRLSTGAALRFLWNKSAFTLTENELKSLSNMSDEVDLEFSNLVKNIEGVGNLIMNDKESGCFQDTNSVSALLLSLANQIDSLQNFAWVTNDARGMLDYKASKQ
jgi:hypothetical protein